MMRVMLYEAAQSMLRSKRWSWLKHRKLLQSKAIAI
jgi:transposase